MPRTTSTTPTTSAVLSLPLLAVLLAGCGASTTPARAVSVVGQPSPTASVPSAAPQPVPSSSPVGAPEAVDAPVGAADPVGAPTEPVASPSVGEPSVGLPADVPVGAPSSAPSVVAPQPASPSSPAAPAAEPPRRPAGPDVGAVQRRLRELRYYAAAVDGVAGPAMRSAVMAFQKVHDLRPDGVVGPRTLAALASPRAPVLRHGSPADRVEVDLDRQVLYVVEDGSVVRILPVSSGNGESYRQKDGGRARALTPVGTYRIERRIVGVRHADLGTLYDPQYFHRGYAIHGSNSVPAGPASHGCVRVSRADAKYLLEALAVGTTVHLYGGEHVFSPSSGGA